jgi:2-amino-4-hydroxy-6-hydroxymethyldihydropteridine diphosphokinase
VTRVIWSLGSNLGDRLAHLQAAVDGLAATQQVRAVSPVYETQPVGGAPQPAYLNAVVLTDAPPGTTAGDLLALAASLEQREGRVRGVRWGARTLDVDVISVLADDGSLVSSDDAELTLPHPRAHQRGFVLVPWADVDTDAVLAGHGRVADLLGRVDRAGVRRTDQALREPA